MDVFKKTFLLITLSCIIGPSLDTQELEFKKELKKYFDLREEYVWYIKYATSHYGHEIEEELIRINRIGFDAIAAVENNRHNVFQSNKYLHREIANLERLIWILEYKYQKTGTTTPIIEPSATPSHTIDSNGN